MPLTIAKPFKIIGPTLPIVSGSIDSRHSMVALSSSSVVLIGRNDSEASGYVQKLSISGTDITLGTAVKFEANGDMRNNVCSVTSASATRVVAGHPLTAGGVYLTNIDVTGVPSLLSGNVVTQSNSTSTAIFPNADQSGINVFSGIRRNGRNQFTVATVSGAVITTTEDDDLFTPVGSGDQVWCTRRSGPSTGRVVTTFEDSSTESLISVDTFTTTRTNIIQISLPTGNEAVTGNSMLDFTDTTQCAFLYKQRIALGASVDGWHIQALNAVDTGTPALSGTALAIPGQTSPATVSGISRVCKLDSSRVFYLYQKSGTTNGPINYRIIDVSGASPIDSGTDVELSTDGDLRSDCDVQYLADGTVIVAFLDNANLGGDVGIQVLTGL